MLTDKLLYFFFTLVAVVFSIFLVRDLVRYQTASSEYKRIRYIAESDTLPAGNVSDLSNVSSVSEDLSFSGDDPLEKPQSENPAYLDLYRINPDLIGILEIPSLDICYPVVQGPDNEKYLHLTFEGKENPAGCIFLDAENSRDLSDDNIIIYGHNMKDGSMFGRLKRFMTDKELCSEDTGLVIHMADKDLFCSFLDARVIDISSEKIGADVCPCVTLYTCWKNEDNKKLVVRFVPCRK